MPFTTAQVVQSMRNARLAHFSPRKLERWANLGVIPHAQRRGRGRGKGWEHLWPDEAMWGALFVVDAFSWQKGRRFEDAVLWAWLRGAPIPLRVVRRYLLHGIRRQRHWLERQLRRQRRSPEDEPLDLVDRLAKVLASKHGTLRKLRVPTRQRLQVMQESLAHLTGQAWTENRDETIDLYKRADQTILSPLIGVPWKRLRRYFSPAKDVPLERRFYSYPRLEQLVRSIRDEPLLNVREAFASTLYSTSILINRMSAGERVPEEAKALAQDFYRIYSALFQMDPSWVIVLFLKSNMGKQRMRSA